MEQFLVLFGLLFYTLLLMTVYNSLDLAHLLSLNQFNSILLIANLTKMLKRNVSLHDQIGG